MHCKKIKDLLMTDFIDGQMDAKLYEQVRGHLKTCKQCGQFERVLRRSVVEPFAKLGKVKPPDSVWQKIKEDIIRTEHGQSAGVLAWLKNYLHGLFRAPQPVLAFAATLLIFLLTAGIAHELLNGRRTINAYVQEQEEFVSNLNSEEENSLTMNHNGLDTVLDEYYL